MSTNPTITAAARQLADYLRTLSDFTLITRATAGDHMGALLTDAILQQGMRYKRQVLPRVRRVATTYPEAQTTTGFVETLATYTPEAVVDIRGRKAIRVQALARFLQDQGIETVAELRTWLAEEPACDEMLLALDGIGPKTTAYLRLLAGLNDAVAVDTHVRALLAEAGITPGTPADAATIVSQAAALLGVTPGDMDASIWRYRTGSG